MYFNSGIRLVHCNINSSTCISIRAFDRLTAILIHKYMHFSSGIQPVDCNFEQVHVFQFGHLTG